MLQRILPALSGLLVLGCLVTESSRAATFTVSPPSLPADSPSAINLAAHGFASHQGFLLEEFLDANGNGAIDSGDLLLVSFRVTDGEVPLFGGVRDTQRPGDEDGSTNGQISVVLTLSQFPERARVSGKYVFRLSTDESAPMIQTFEIAAGNYAQAITGHVTSGGTAVSSAAVVLLSVAGDDMEFVGGAVANASGQFVVKAPPGEYAVVPFRDGYVADTHSAAFGSLVTAVDTVQDVILLAADRVLSGRVFDGINSNGVAGMQLFLQSSDGLLTLSTTDEGGYFSIPVKAGEWEIELSEKSAALVGYGKTRAQVDASAGDVSGINLAVTRARGGFGLVFFFPPGSFGSGTNGVLQYPTRLDYYYGLFNVQDIGLPTNVFFTGPAGSGLANAPSAVFGANFEGDSAFYSSPQVSIPTYPPGGIYVVNYKNEPQQFQVVDPTPEAHQVIPQPTVSVDNAGYMHSITWSYRDMAGNVIARPSFVASINIRVDGIGGRLYDVDVSPDQPTHFVADPVIWTNVSSIQMVYQDALRNEFVTFWNRGQQLLEIVSPSMPGARVGSAYDQLFVAAGGMTPYSWSFISGTLPSGLSFAPVTGELHGTPLGSGTFSFTVRVSDAVGQSIEKCFDLVVLPATQAPALQPMALSSPGQFNLRFAGEPGSDYALEYSTNLTDWLTLMVTNASAGTVDFHDLTATNRLRFYRILLNP